VEISKSNLRRERFLRYAPLFLWIAVIFFLSSSLGSMSHTSRIIRPLLEWLFPSASVETITTYHAFIRKCAHFTEYSILAFWSWRAFHGSSKKFLQNYKYAAALGLVVLAASLDEFGQSFNPARTGSPYDVLLDAAGGLTMILFLWFVIKKQSASTGNDF
jgi:VanZ family protein